MKSILKTIKTNVVCKNLRECTVNEEIVGSKTKTNTAKAKVIH